MRIPLYKSTMLRGWARVDEADYSLVIQHLWRPYAAGGCYAATTPPGSGLSLLMHRLIMGLDPGDGLVVDHINGDGLDNRRSNLRVCTQAQNMQNRRGSRRGSSSRFRGVTKTRTGRWVAQAKLEGQHHYLGSYDTETEAGAVALAFRRENFTHFVDREDHRAVA